MKIKSHTPSGIALTAAALVAVAACDNGTGVAGPGTVSLNFRVPGSGAPALAPAAPGLAAVAGPPMTIEGTNGDLVIDEIRVIIDEAELKPADGSCDLVVDASDDDDCPDFEAPPRFLDLPLDGEPIEAMTAVVPAGVYKELDFEIEDLEDDEEDPAEAAAIAALRAAILSEIPDWPWKASTLVVGRFESTAGGSIEFRVFLDAEIEIELDLIPNLVVGEDGSLSRELTVDVRPDIWFGRPDGSVVPLHLFDYGLTGELYSIEVEMENGFTDVEIG